MYVQPTGLKYTRFLRRLHRRHIFDWYLEVGCRTGTTIAPSRSKTVAVDPFFKIDTNVIGPKPALHVFQATSDAFFESGFLRAIQARLSFSFLDGMHLFEFLLRDFMNAEAASRPDGIIALHDCCPSSLEMTTRDLDNIPKGAWTGDVWKLIPILQEFRPDLTIKVLDCAPTGLVLISGLDPDNRVLRQAYDTIVDRYRDRSIEDFGPAAFYERVSYVDAQAYCDEGFPDFAPISLPEESLVIPTKITP
ncbi:hypothetical protein QCN27_03570 [Cereibacter sp. SYSU M97828]|nr:hypothetical protein [Cereibacter flavus]